MWGMHRHSKSPPHCMVPPSAITLIAALPQRIIVLKCCAILKIRNWSTWLQGYQIRVNHQLSQIITTGLFSMACFHLREHKYNYSIQPILVPIALFTSLSWNGLGARNEGLSGDKRFPSSRFQDFLFSNSQSKRISVLHFL